MRLKKLEETNFSFFFARRTIKTVCRNLKRSIFAIEITIIEYEKNIFRNIDCFLIRSMQ